MPTPPSRLVFLALAAIAPLAAQESRNLFDAAQVQLPDDSPPFQRLADFDGDGQLDAVGTRVYSTGTQVEVCVWRNELGKFVQRFDEVVAASGHGQRMSVATGDLDGDGDQDFVAGSGTSILTYLNQGNFTFTRSVTFVNTTVTNVALADLDSDGQLDLIYTTIADVNVRLASGPLLTLPVANDITTRIEVCDLDGDAAPEFGCYNTLASVFHPFAVTNGALVALPNLAPALSSPFNIVYWATGDLDNDGDIDLLACELPSRTIIFRRTGAATFVAEAPYTVGPVEFLKDIDGDGIVDGICCGGGGGGSVPPSWPQLNFGSYFRISLNRGGVLGPTFEIPGKGSTQLAGLADIDGDGDNDLVAGASVYFARGPLTQPPCKPSGLDVGYVANLPRQRDDVRDNDRDGDADFGIGPDDIRSSSIQRINDATGAMTLRSTPVPVPANMVVGQPAFRGDFDGDGAPDVVIPLYDASTLAFAQMELLRNNGSGTLLDAGVASPLHIGWAGGPTPGYRNSTLVADVDNDGDLDLIANSDPLWEQQQRSELWLNQGNGTFVPGATLANERIAAVADFDGNGTLDFVTQGSPFGAINVRTGTGQPANPFGALVTGFPITTIDNEPGSFQIVEVNDDGLPDLAIRTVPSAAVPKVVSIYCNRSAAAGTLAFSFFPLTFQTAGLVAVADFDGDGRSDIALTAPSGATNQTRFLRRLTGTGQVLTPADYAPPLAQAIWDGVPVDADGDGDLDFVGTRIMKNVRWHGPAAGARRQYGTGTAGEAGITPLLGVAGPIRDGSTADMRLQGITGPTLGLLAIGLTETNQPNFLLPGLTLLVGPSPLLTSFLPLNAPSGGTASGSFHIPVVIFPGLVGIDTFNQVFVLDNAAPSGVACSNGLATHIGG